MQAVPLGYGEGRYIALSGQCAAEVIWFVVVYYNSRGPGGLGVPHLDFEGEFTPSY